MPTGQVRIVAGRWRGRKLSVVHADGLRPTGDRVRETVFNWLQMQVPGSHCLDLFAGSGALGLEAASRGAASVVLVESDELVAAELRSTLTMLDGRSGGQGGGGGWNQGGGGSGGSQGGGGWNQGGGSSDGGGQSSGQSGGGNGGGSNYDDLDDDIPF